MGGGHAFGVEAHAAGGDVDLGAFVEDVDLVEGAHDVGVDGEDAMFFPHDDVVVFVESADGRFSELVGGGHHVRHHSKASGTEGLGLRNHGPEHTGGHILLHPLPAVGQRHELNRMRMQTRPVRRAFPEQVVVHRQM